MILEYIIIIFSLMITGYFIFKWMHQRLKNQKSTEILNILKQYGEVTEHGKNYQFKHASLLADIQLFYLPMHSELTINSKTIWEVRMMHKSQLINQSQLTSTQTLKWIIVFPSNQPIKRYINENELEFVKPSDVFYHMQVMHIEGLKSHLEQISKK